MTTETYTEYGVFVWHGTAEVLYRTFKKAETGGIWRNTVTDEEAARISSFKKRQVTVQLGEWSPT